MIFYLTMLLPCSEITHLAVVSVVGEPHLGADEKDLPIMYDYPAVVDDILVDDWPGVALNHDKVR